MKCEDCKKELCKCETALDHELCECCLQCQYCCNDFDDCDGVGNHLTKEQRLELNKDLKADADLQDKRDNE